MENSDLCFPPREVEHPRLESENERPSSSPQLPLSDKETVGFYKAMQDEREKRQALERQLAELHTSRETTDQPPLSRELEETVYANNLRVSRRFAEREYGREVVAAVHEWAAAKCDADPLFNQRMRASVDPYEDAKAFYDREHGFSSPSSQAARTPFKILDSAPPRSLADAPGNGAAGKPHTPVGDGNAYASLFR